MLSLTLADIRASFVNASRKEASDASLPDLDALDFDRLDYLGWRDKKIGRRAYLVLPTDDGPVGVVLRQAENAPRTRAQCSWCQDITLPSEVTFYSAKRAGAAGRNGDTVGTLMCMHFECSVNVRRPVPPAYLGYDVEAARRARIEALRERAAGFASSVL